MSNYLARLPTAAQSAFLAYREGLLPCDAKANAEEALVNFAIWHAEMRWTFDTFERVFGAKDALAGKAITNAIIVDQERAPPRQTMGGHPTPWTLKGDGPFVDVIDADGVPIVTMDAGQASLFWAPLVDDVNRVTHANREAGLVDKLVADGHPAGRLSFPARLAFETAALLGSPVKARKAPMDELIKAGLVVRLDDPKMYVVDPAARERFVEWQSANGRHSEASDDGASPLLSNLLAGRAALKRPTQLHEDDDALPPPPEVYGEPVEVPGEPEAADKKSEADALAEADRLRAMRARIKRWTTTKRR